MSDHVADGDPQIMKQLPQDDMLPKDAVKDLKDMLAKHTEQVAIVEASACTRKSEFHSLAIIIKYNYNNNYYTIIIMHGLKF